MIGQVKTRIARARFFDKIIDDIGQITDHRSGEGDHADDDDRQTGQGQRNARGADILDDSLDTARVQDHRHRIIGGVEEIHLLGTLQGKRTDYRGGCGNKQHVEQDDQNQNHTFRMLGDLNTQPFSDLHYHTNLRIIFHNCLQFNDNRIMDTFQ